MSLKIYVFHLFRFIAYVQLWIVLVENIKVVDHKIYVAFTGLLYVRTWIEQIKRIATL